MNSTKFENPVSNPQTTDTPVSNNSSNSTIDVESILPSRIQSFDLQHEPDSNTNIDNINQHPEVDLLGSARTPWYGTSMILLAEVLGTGVLSLPYAAVTLGFASSVAFLIVFAFAANYCSLLLSHVRQQCPHVRSYADAATELVGVKFGKFTMGCMILNWVALAIYFVVAASDALGTVSGTASSGWLSCKIDRTVISALVFALVVQVRDYHAISKYLSVPSFIAIIVAIVVTLVTVIIDDERSGEEFASTTTVGPAPGTDAFDFISAMSSIVFAYQGQSIFLELMAEMKQSSQFPRACNVAYMIMLLAYVTTTVLAYGSQGSETPGFLPNMLESGSPAAKFVGLLTFFHIVVAYVVTVQPVHVWFHSSFRSSTLYKGDFSGTRDWLIITVSFTAFAWVVANLIPFFADLQSIIGSLFGAPIMFGWPTLFFYMSKKREAKSFKETLSLMGTKNVIICGIMMFVFTPLFVIVGTYGGLVTLIHDTEKDGNPFGC